MKIVAGLNLVNIKPPVWDEQSSYHLPELQALMVSYADFHQSPTLRNRSMDKGLHASLNVPKHVKIYLDNGAFRFSRDGIEVSRPDYEAFVQNAQPDWYVIPQDYIPSPLMSDAEQLECLKRTMDVNQAYSHDGYVPILHISRYLDRYLRQLTGNQQLQAKQVFALGGIVPNLLRAPKAMSYKEVLRKVRQVRSKLENRILHVFGIGGTATLHLAALIGMDSVDSSGWRIRAARGLVQMPGVGDRTVADLGNWKVREPSSHEWEN